jgi:glutamine amidotransferase-like uncharacterized protein
MITTRRFRATAIPPLIAIAVAVSACDRFSADRDVAPNASVVLFAGNGTSPNDVAAFERILTDSAVDYTTATSRQLTALSDAQLRAHRLLIVPGGNFVELGNSLDAETAARLRSAIGHGLNYLGVCAGAFFAGHSPYNGLDLTEGVRFPFYAAENRGIRKTAVSISIPDGPAVDHYWEDGPQLRGWGEITARYPDGTPAVVQGRFGQGWVVLSGVHPEAPESWRRGLAFTTSTAASHAYAARLVDAALNRRRLPHY